jgi:hypothetical protein
MMEAEYSPQTVVGIYLHTLKMKAVCSSETLVPAHKLTRRYAPHHFTVVIAAYLIWPVVTFDYQRPDPATFCVAGCKIRVDIHDGKIAGFHGHGKDDVARLLSPSCNSRHTFQQNTLKIDSS